jgi:hypothetical protein
MLISTRETGKRRSSFGSALHYEIEVHLLSDIIALNALAMLLIIAVLDGPLEGRTTVKVII